MKSTTCIKCGIREAVQEDGLYPLCYICFLKEKRFYSFAIKTIKETNWWNCKTNITSLKVGWSFVELMLWNSLFGSVLNCGSLNKNPKCPELLNNTKTENFRILGYSEWQIKTCFEYYLGLED